MKNRNFGWFLLKISLCCSAIAFGFAKLDWTPNILVSAQLIPIDRMSPLSSRIYRRCRSATVRVVKADSAGSGVIINRNGNVYSVLTNWHVVDSSNPLILTVDNQQHQLVQAPQQIGNVDLALLQFYSDAEYPMVEIETKMPQLGETVYVAGFPLNNESDELGFGNESFRLTQGKVSVVPAKSLPQGYQLGYTNTTEMGMSGSPIFDAEGSLVAIHGRGKYRDPGFGVYIFEDGSEPSPPQLKQMIQASWGIPIEVYTKLYETP